MKPKALEQNIVSMILPRLQDEYDAAAMYKGIANWCKGNGYEKAATYFDGESADELKHAQRLMEYLTDWNIYPEIPDVPAPKIEYKDLVEALETAYNTEYSLYEKYEGTAKEMFTADLCTFKLMQDYLQIQVESVAEYSDKLNMLEGCDKTKTTLLLLEDKLF
jgi:ferritin